MKTLEKGRDKIQKICEALREETLEPAKLQAEEIIRDANKKADKLIADAKEGAIKIHEQAKAEIEKTKNAFEASLSQGSKQALEALKQAIENHFFNSELPNLIKKNAADPRLIADLINAIVEAIQKDGIRANLTAIIPEQITPQEVNQLLLSEVLQSLNGKSVELGQIAAGARIKLSDKKMTIDISESALKELLATHIVRKEFRKLFFE